MFANLEPTQVINPDMDANEYVAFRDKLEIGRKISHAIEAFMYKNIVKNVELGADMRHDLVEIIRRIDDAKRRIRDHMTYCHPYYPGCPNKEEHQKIKTFQWDYIRPLLNDIRALITIYARRRSNIMLYYTEYNSPDF